jgi:Papain family cysteine protease
MLIKTAAGVRDYYGDFTGIPGTCKNTQSGLKQKFSKWSDVYPAEDLQIEDTLQQKVLSVMVKMPNAIKLYKSGVYTAT